MIIIKRLIDCNGAERFGSCHSCCKPADQDKEMNCHCDKQSPLKSDKETALHLYKYISQAKENNAQNIV